MAGQSIDAQGEEHGRPVHRRATATGDGRNGHATSEDGHLDLDLRIPKEMGGEGGATNPEELFAAGYAACFHSALKLVAGGAPT